MMVILNHKHDFAATNDGYRCTACSASVTHEQIKLNPTQPDAHNVWKKINL